jgi:hypothetical protein
MVTGTTGLWRGTSSKRAEPYVCLLKQRTHVYQKLELLVPSSPLWSSSLAGSLPHKCLPTLITQHVSFWDRHKTGVIYPWDTYNGFRALGFCSLVAVSYALAFHLLHTSYWTSVSSWKRRESGIEKENMCQRGKIYLTFLFSKCQFTDLPAAQPAPSRLRRAHPPGQARQRYGYLRLRWRVSACEFRTDFPALRQVSLI